MSAPPTGPVRGGGAPSITVYRIGADTPTYTANDRTGEGAKRHGARWNHKGSAAIYTASTRALACLETLSHLSRNGSLPYNRYLVEYTIPAAAWTVRAHCDPAAHVGWDARPPGLVSQSWGTAWLASGSSMVAEVPSVLIPEEANVLLNPAHPLFADVTLRKVRRWRYDPRLLVPPQPARPA